MKTKKRVGNVRKNFCLLVLAFMCILGVSTTSRAYSYHTRDEAVNWARGQINKSLDYDNYAGAQCVDLIKYYYAYFGVAGYAMGNANAYITNNLPSGWQRVYGNYQPGDIAVWKTNHNCSTCGTTGLGHVGIIISADSTGFNAVNQNFGGRRYCTQNWFYCSALACAIRPVYKSNRDTAKPQISNVRISNVDKDGYTVTCNVSDNVGVTRVLFPSWNMDKHGGNDANWIQGSVSGGTASCRINLSSLKSGAVEGNYMTHVYAYDAAGNSSGASAAKTYIDRTAPSITDAKILSQDARGYYIECKVTDANGVNRVQCPTWTSANGQDDLAKDWGSNASVRAYAAGTNTYRFRVNRTAHNDEAGPYITHLYAYDSYGNATCMNQLPTVTLCKLMEAKKMIRYKDQILAIYDEDLKWDKIQELAGEVGGRLVTITDSEKQKAVEELLEGRLRTYYYVGFRQTGKNAPWQWASGEEFSYSNWASGQPDCMGNNEFYGSVIQADGKWNDLPDGYANAGFILEIPIKQTEETKQDETKDEETKPDGKTEIQNPATDFGKETEDEEEGQEEKGEDDEDEDVIEEEEKLEIGKAKIRSLKNQRRKKLKVTVRSTQDADYYQFRIGTNKSMTKNKKTMSSWKRTVTFKKLKKKTYYVKVRGYAYENGKKVYGEWSAVKKIKIKK